MADENANLTERLTHDGAVWRTHCAVLADITQRLQDITDALDAWTRCEAALYARMIDTVQLAVLAVEDEGKT